MIRGFSVMLGLLPRAELVPSSLRPQSLPWGSQQAPCSRLLERTCPISQVLVRTSHPWKGGRLWSSSSRPLAPGSRTFEFFPVASFPLVPAPGSSLWWLLTAQLFGVWVVFFLTEPCLRNFSGSLYKVRSASEQAAILSPHSGAISAPLLLPFSFDSPSSSLLGGT